MARPGVSSPQQALGEGRDQQLGGGRGQGAAADERGQAVDEGPGAARPVRVIARSTAQLGIGGGRSRSRSGRRGTPARRAVARRLMLAVPTSASSASKSDATSVTLHKGQGT
jgi:hypothetical protein